MCARTFSKGKTIIARQLFYACCSFSFFFLFFSSLSSLVFRYKSLPIDSHRSPHTLQIKRSPMHVRWRSTRKREKLRFARDARPPCRTFCPTLSFSLHTPARIPVTLSARTRTCISLSFLTRKFRNPPDKWKADPPRDNARSKKVHTSIANFNCCIVHMCVAYICMRDAIILRSN